MKRFSVTLGVLAAVGNAAVLAAILAQPAAAAARTAARQGPRVAIILFDTNISPAAGLQPASRLRAEHQEATAYARALPRDVRVGLIVFGDTSRQALSPTTSRARLAAALTAIRPLGATSKGLQAAVAKAAAEIRRLRASQSRLLVLTNAEFLKRPVQPVGIPADVVASRYDPDDFPATARALATASGGRVGTAGTVAALAAAFAPLRPPTPSATPSPSAASAPAATAAGWHRTNALMDLLALVFAVLLVLAFLVIRSLRRGDRRPQLHRQIARYGPMGAVGPVVSPETESRVAKGAVEAMRQVLRARGTEPRLALRLDRAGITRQPAEWALLGVCLSVVLGAAFTLVLGNPAIGVLIGIFAGYAAMRLILTIRIDRRRAAFADQLPNLLNLVAGSLQTGFSLPQAIDSVVRENTQPASGEFSRALAETRLGIDLVDALQAVATRLKSSDLQWVVMAIAIQRETGGNLAEILRNTVATMRERAYLRRQVRSLSAEGRLSAYVLLGLPPLIGAWMFYSAPSYMHPLYSTFAGLAMLIGAIVLLLVGSFWMRNLIRLEV